MGIGVIALGIFVGWITRIFVKRIGSYTLKAVGGIIGVVLGGTILKLFTDPGTFDDLFWYYPIGLVIGFAIGAVKDGF